MRYNVIFQPAGWRGTVLAGKSLLEISREAGVDIEVPCGGTGMCGKCKIKVEEGFFETLGITSRLTNVSPITEKERKLLSQAELTDHYRLACCAKIQGDILIYVPEQSRAAKQIILESGREKAFVLKPAIAQYSVKLNKPTLEDNRDDFSRIKDALGSGFIQFDKNIDIDYSLLTQLPDILRQNRWQANVVVWNDSEIIAVQPQGEEGLYGIAIDIGTTTIAAYLCDLATGSILARESLINSQVRYGDDVISRITYCMMNDGGLSTLNKIIIEDINVLVQRLTKTVRIEPERVLEMVLVFNTVMHHLVLNINPQYIGSVPFTSAIRSSCNIKAKELGIEIAKGGYVHCLPIEAGFVGADNVAVLIAEEPYKQDKMMLVIDIGTNGEINFGNKEGMLSASCATGPALEGAQIKFGMRAALGAIERVAINAFTKEAEVKTIGESMCGSISSQAAAKGICGSGIIDAVAELFKAGIIRSDGTFNKKIESPRVRQGVDGKVEYVLAWAPDTAIGQDITITQKDVRAVQLAKAALYAGAKILMQKKGVEKVDEVILAGAFGNYINKENALVIGMFPDCDLENVTAVGNAAGEGAKLALMNVDKRAEAEQVASFIQSVETATESEFQTNFYDAMFFPHAKDAFPHIQQILTAIPV